MNFRNTKVANKGLIVGVDRRTDGQTKNTYRKLIKMLLANRVDRDIWSWSSLFAYGTIERSAYMGYACADNIPHSTKNWPVLHFRDRSVSALRDGSERHD